MLGDLDSYVQKNETWSPTYAIHKNKVKMDKRLKYKLRYHLSPRGEHRQENFRYSTDTFTDISPRARDIKERINKWDFIKIKNVCSTPKINKIKRTPTIWENILANDTLDKALMSKIYKEVILLNARKRNNPIKKNVQRT